MILSITPNLMVADVRKSTSFYEQNLGFEIMAWVENEQNEEIWDFVMILRDGVTLMLQSVETLEAEVPTLKRSGLGQGGTLYFKVDNVEAYYKKLTGKVTFLNELHETFYNTREFNIADIDGNVITLAQDNDELLIEEIE